MLVACEELTDCFDKCNNGKNGQNISLQYVPPVLKAMLHSGNKVDNFSLLTKYNTVNQFLVHHSPLLLKEELLFYKD